MASFKKVINSEGIMEDKAVYIKPLNKYVRAQMRNIMLERPQMDTQVNLDRRKQTLENQIGFQSTDDAPWAEKGAFVHSLRRRSAWLTSNFLSA